VGARGRRPPWSPPWVPVTLGQFCFFLSFTLYLAPALPSLLFFLIFYSLFGPCPARPFIFPYLLLFIWPLPCPPFYFSLSFTLYLAPALPARPCPCPALQDRQTDGPCPAPCPALPCVAARFSASGGRAVSKLSGGRAGSAIENCIGIAAIAKYRGRPVLP
jgi:hypothetical protein